MIGLRIILLIIGYVCGLLETGVLYGKISGTDIKNMVVEILVQLTHLEY